MYGGMREAWRYEVWRYVGMRYAGVGVECARPAARAPSKGFARRQQEFMGWEV